MKQRQIPRGPENLFCPWWQKPMSEVCHTCPLWTQVRGNDPQSGAEYDEWNCAMAWMPVVGLEIANQTRQNGAAVEGLRNNIARGVAQRELEKRNAPAIISQ